MPSNVTFELMSLFANSNLKKASWKFSIGNNRSPILLHQHSYLHHTQKIMLIELIP